MCFQGLGRHPRSQSLRPWACLPLFVPVRRTFFQAPWVLFFFLFHFFCSLFFLQSPGLQEVLCEAQKAVQIACLAEPSISPHHQRAPEHRNRTAWRESVGKPPKLPTLLWTTQPGVAVKSGGSLGGWAGRGPKRGVLPSSTKCCLLLHHRLLPNGPVTC